MKIIIFLIPLFLFSTIKDINNQIKNSKTKLYSTKKEKITTQKKIDFIAEQIKKSEKEIDELNKKIESIQNDISLNKFKLKKAKTDLEKLLKQEKTLSLKIDNLQQFIIKLITQQQSLSLGKKYINNENIDDIVKNELYDTILKTLKSEILSSNINYLASVNQKRKNQIKQTNIKQYIQKQNQKKEELAKLKLERENKKQKLDIAYKEYQKKLTKIVNKQYQLNKLLSTLNILKTKTIKKKKKLSKLDFSVKSEKPKKQKGIKIASKESFKKRIKQKIKTYSNNKKYSKPVKLNKTIKNKKIVKPLKSFIVEKKFGKYYDKLYNIEIVNDGVTLKSKIKNAKVYNIITGKVVYSKYNAGILGNIVIIENKKEKLHVVYTNLLKISPEVRKGAILQVGKVVGRIDDKLSVQVMKNGRYLNPMTLINKKI